MRGAHVHAHAHALIEVFSAGYAWSGFAPLMRRGATAAQMWHGVPAVTMTHTRPPGSHLTGHHA